MATTAAPAARRGPPLPWLKPAIYVGGAVPLAWMIVRAVRGTLGSNPVAEALNQLGLLALIFLMGALAMTPLKLVFGWSWPIRVRRLVGVYAFFYATLHFLTYAVIDQGLDLGAVIADIGTRQFIFVGFATWLLLLPLAVTSTNRMVRRLGFVRWQRIHRLVYLAGVLGVVHFLMRVKKDVTEPVIFGMLLFVLFFLRIRAAQRKRAAREARGR
jgi:methionine sulfoxide reductase heme-binding subunit